MTSLLALLLGAAIAYAFCLRQQAQDLRLERDELKRIVLPRLAKPLTAGEISQISAERHKPSRKADSTASQALRYARPGWGAARAKLEDLSKPEHRQERVMAANDI